MVIAANAANVPILAAIEKSLDRIICKYIIIFWYRPFVFKKVAEHEASYSLEHND